MRTVSEATSEWGVRGSEREQGVRVLDRREAHALWRIHHLVECRRSHGVLAENDAACRAPATAVAESSGCARVLSCARGFPQCCGAVPGYIRITRGGVGAPFPPMNDPGEQRTASLSPTFHTGGAIGGRVFDARAPGKSAGSEAGHTNPTRADSKRASWRRAGALLCGLSERTEEVDRVEQLRHVAERRVEDLDVKGLLHQATADVPRVFAAHDERDEDGVEELEEGELVHVDALQRAAAQARGIRENHQLCLLNRAAEFHRPRGIGLHDTGQRFVFAGGVSQGAKPRL